MLSVRVVDICQLQIRYYSEYTIFEYMNIQYDYTIFELLTAICPFLFTIYSSSFLTEMPFNMNFLTNQYQQKRGTLLNSFPPSFSWQGEHAVL